MPVALNDSFRRIRLEPDGVEVVADRVADQLTLTAGVGLSFIIDPETDSVVLYNTGAPLGIANLDDVVEVGNTTWRTVEVGKLVVNDHDPSDPLHATVLRSLDITGSSIQADPNVNLTLTVSGTGTVIVNTNKALQIPVGNNAQRPTPAVGQIRFNTEITQFEGYDGANWNTLGGVRSVDGGTTITPDQSLPILNFYTDGELAATFSKINNRFLSPGLIIPTGDSASRPPAEVGQIRFNTQLSQFEGYNGTGWSSLGGVRDIDGNTYITPELEPGSNENTLFFVTNANLAVTIDGNKVTLENNRYLSFKESLANGENSVNLVAPASVPESFTLKLPSVPGGDGNILSVDANGQLEFVNSDTFAGGRVIVSADFGDDLNDGINRPVRSIKRALQIASGIVYSPRFVYNETACRRDAGLIIDALGWDLAYGSNWQSVKSALMYYNAPASVVLSSQKSQTVLAVSYLKNKAVATLTGTSATAVGSLADTMIDILSTGESATPAIVIPTPAGADSGFANAKDLVLANVDFLVAEVIGWINNQISTNAVGWESFSYNQAMCARDTRYIVYSLAYDLIYGGNSQSIDAGLKYFDGVGNTIVLQNPGETFQTAAALEHLKTIIQQVAQNTTVSPVYSTEPQVSGTAGSGTAASTLAGRLVDIIAIVNNGVVSAPAIELPTASINVSLAADQATLQSAKDRIADNVIAYTSDYAPNGKKLVISVAAGNYVEQNPLIIPDNVSVLGASLRSCDVRPANANQDMFRLRNGAYFGEFTFRDAIDENGVPVHTFDYAVAFDNVNDITVDRLGYTNLPISKPIIFVSPYIQNVSILSFLGGNGAKVDGALVQTPNVPDIQILTENPVSGPAPEQGKSFVANAFTMLSFGGTGWRLMNDAYAQIVSCFQIFMLNGSYCQSGGYLSITNSATNFGLYALRASGYSPNAFQFDKGYVAATGTANSKQTLTVLGFGRQPTQDFVIRFRNPNYKVAYDLLEASKDSIQTQTIDWITTQINGNISPFTSGFTYDQSFCRRDVGLIIDAVAYDVFTGGNVKSVEAATSQLDVAAIMLNQLDETIAAINYAKSLAQTAVASTGLSSYVGEKFDIITNGLADPASIPEAYGYSSVGDITNTYKPASTEFTFNAATDVNESLDTISVPGHGLLNGAAIIYDANGNPEIPGLNTEQTYYVNYVDSTTFRLTFDESGTIPVSIRAAGTGTHKFIKNLQEFYVDEVIESHTSYQELTLAPGSYTFTPGSQITGVTGVTVNDAFVYSYDPVSYKLVVSLNKVTVGSSTIRNTFDATSIINSDNGSPAVTNIDVVSANAINTLHSAIFSIQSTTTGGQLTSLATLPNKQIWLHRPSIVNSSGHTWEYAGSGTDYNALPQNGGQTKVKYEQYSDLPGRVYSSGTNELGDFKVGDFIKAENKTGNVSFTNKVSVAQLDALRLAVGDIVIELISNDIDLGDNEPGGASDSRLSTQKAIRSFMSNRLGGFIDKAVSTNAVPGAIIQLNSSGQINPDLLPAVRTFNSAKSYGFYSRLSLLEEVPAGDFLNGDIVTEEYSTVQLTLSAPINGNLGDLVVQATTGATGYLASNVVADNVITVASTAAAFNATFNTTNNLTIASDSTPSTTNTTVKPNIVGVVAANVPANYVLSNSNQGQYLLLDPAGTYSFTPGNFVTSTNDQVQGTITSTRYGVLDTVDNANITPGSGYTPTSGTVTYTMVPLTNVTGTGVNGYADITVTNGVVSAVDLRRGGTGYAVGNQLSVLAANVGGTGSGFRIPVTTVEDRLYVNLIGGEKFVATLASPNFIADNNAQVNNVTTTSFITKSFNAQDTGLGGAVDYVNSRITIASHGLANGDPVKYVSSPNTPIGSLSNDEVYYVKFYDTNTIELYEDYNLVTKITFTSSSTGTHTLTVFNFNVVDNSVYIPSHGYNTGDPFRLTGASLPQVGGVPIVSGSFFFVGSKTQNSFTIHTARSEALASVNGLVVNRVMFTTTGSGTATFTKQNVIVQGVVNTSSTNPANWSPLSATTIDASNIVGGVISTSRLAGSGIANDTTYLRGDSTWHTAVQSLREIDSPITLSGSYTTSNSKDYYYGDVQIDVDRVDGVSGDATYTNPGVVKLRKSQFDVGTGLARGEVFIKDGVVDAGTLDQLDSAYFLNPANLTSNVPVTRGGTGLNTYAAGDLLYASNAAILSRLGIGANNAILVSNGSQPVWSNNLSLSGNLSINNAQESTSTTTGTLTVVGGVGIEKRLNVGGAVSIGGDLNVTGNVNVAGTITTINSTIVNIDDKNIELGSVAAISGLSGTISGNTVTGLATTVGLTFGMKIVKTSGTGSFGDSPTVNTIVNDNTITVNIASGANTNGTIVFDILGATNVTADGGGITLKGTTDKTLNWYNSTSAWTSSEHFSIASGKEYRINGVKVLDATSLGSNIQSIGTITTGVWHASIIDPTYGGTGVNNGTKTITLGGNLVTSGAFNTTITATADTSVTLPTTGTLATLSNAESLSNKTLVNPKISDASETHTYNFAVNELAANRTITLPLLSGNDTFVFEAHTQTLSNKTLTAPKINDSSSTHTYNFAVNELAANRTITLPLLSGNDTFVFEAHTQTLSNKTLTTPKILDSNSTHNYVVTPSDISADRNVILPLLSSDDTFVFQSHTQTLTNKSFSDFSTYFIDESDNTKRLQLQLSSVSTGTTRTLTVPNQSGTIAVTSDIGNGTLTLNVSGNGLSGSQTFTANQSTGATFTVTSNATNLNTASTIVFRDASGNFSAGTITANLSGTATQVSNSLSAGSYLVGTAFNGGTAQTWAVDATSASTASKVVARDANGDFSARIVTAELNGTASDVSGTGAALRIANPGGASYASTNSSVTGAIKIKLPTASFKSNTMLRMTIKIYEYAGAAAGTSRTIEVGGYNYSDAPANWVNYFATQITMGGADINVRFGNDGTSQCIWIGETNTVWVYPQVFVTDFQAGYSNQTQAIWASGWSVSINNSFGTVTQGPIIAAKNVTSQNYNSYAPSLTGTGASGSWAINITGDANTLDGQHGSYYQPASSAITTSNIGSQSVTYATSAGNADTVDSLHIHTGRNNEVNKLVRTDANGHILCGYINSNSGDEGNNSNPTRVWGTNGSDSYMRTYLTSALSVNYAATSGDADKLDGQHGSYYQPASSAITTSNIGSQSVTYATSAGNSSTTSQTDFGSLSVTSASPTIWMYDTDQADFAMHVNSNLWYVLNGSSNACIQTDQSGNFTAAGNVFAYSDERLKSNIKTIDSALDKVVALRGVSFTKDGKDSIGLIAQEVEKVLPQVVQDNADGYKSVAYSNIVGVLVEAVKEQQQQITQQQAQINQLIEELRNLKGSK